MRPYLPLVAQIMVRQGRHQEAQARMALAQKNMPPGTQGANAAAPATTVGNPDESLAVVAAKTSASLPPSHQQVLKPRLLDCRAIDGDRSSAPGDLKPDHHDQGAHCYHILDGCGSGWRLCPGLPLQPLSYLLVQSP